MELGLEIARLVIDNRGDSDCSEQMLQKAREIIETGSLLSIHTFTVHRQCNLKFSSCTSVFLLEEWMIKIVPKEKIGEKVLDGLFLKNAVQSYLYSKLNSRLICNGEQLPNDTICKYRISVNNVCLGDQLRNFESHEFPLGQLNILFCVYVTVKWRKYGASSHLSSCSESTGSLSDELLLFSQALTGMGYFTASLPENPGIPFFYVPTKCQQNNQHERIESEHVGEVRDKKVLLENEQIIMSSVESFLTSGSSIKIGFPLQIASSSLSSRRETLPRRYLLASAFRFMSTASKAFSKTTGLPLNSSPAPFSRNETKFVEDQPAKNTRNSILEKTHCNVPADEKDNNPSYCRNKCTGRNISSSNGLLCNFEESALNGRLDLVTSLDGFHLQIAASDETYSPHLTLPVTTFFFNMPEDEAPLPYMGFCSLENMRKGYRIPKKGILQAKGYRELLKSCEVEIIDFGTDHTKFRLGIIAKKSFLDYGNGITIWETYHPIENQQIPKKICRIASSLAIFDGMEKVLFNPQNTVVRMFLVEFDVSDMPPSSQTFLRQRTFFMPVGCPYNDVLQSWFKYLIHLSLATDRRGRLYVHTDIRMLFSQKNELETLNFELGKDVIKYQLQSFTEMPRNPKYSPRKK